VQGALAHFYLQIPTNYATDIKVFKILSIESISLILSQMIRPILPPNSGSMAEADEIGTIAIRIF